MSVQDNQPTQNDFLTFAQHNLQGKTEVISLFEQAGNWQERYRQIMLKGKALPKLDACYRRESVQVKGCESQAWLYHQEIAGKHYFIADSDARIVKGLIALLLSACNAQDSQSIAAFSAEDFFEKLGLKGQLSPSRANGLYALAQAIKGFSAST